MAKRQETVMTTFPLRLPETVMAQARAAAEEDHVSINQMLTALIAEGMGHRRGLKNIRDRAARANAQAALAILDRAPDMPPDEGDETIDVRPTAPGAQLPLPGKPR
jgi:hypothetical protein